MLGLTVVVSNLTSSHGVCLEFQWEQPKIGMVVRYFTNRCENTVVCCVMLCMNKLSDVSVYKMEAITVELRS